VTIGNPAPVALGGARVLLPFCRENKEAGVLLSEDGGATWALVANLSVPANWSWVATGPPGSLLLPSGDILIPSNHIANGAPFSHAYLSADGGRTWSISASVPGGNEDQAVQMQWTQPPSVLLSMRSTGARRLAASSVDGGATWSAPWTTIAETQCEASTVALPDHPAGPRVVMSSAFAATRTNLTLHVSADGGHAWTPNTVVYAGSSAYSSLVVAGADTVALAFERDSYKAIAFCAPLRI
jgi:sialidase-1